MARRAEPVAECPLCGWDVDLIKLDCAFQVARMDWTGALVQIEGPATLEGLGPIGVRDELRPTPEHDVIVLEPCGHRFLRREQPRWIQTLAEKI